MSDEQYYSNPAVSNSKLSMLNPEEGGSPLKYRGYEDNIFEAQETKSLTKGKLLHLYMLEPENYHVLKVPKPSGKLGELIEEFYKEMKTPTFSPTTTVIEGKEQEVQDIIKAYNKICTSLYGDLYSEDQVEEVVKAFRNARSIVAYNRNLKESTAINKFYDEGWEYYIDIAEADGKICGITVEDKNTIDACSLSLKGKPSAMEHLEPNDSFESQAELEIYWNEVIELLGQNVKIPCKAKIDKLNILFNQKLVNIGDLKTTGHPVSQFGRKSFQHYRYYRQAAFYTRAVQMYLINERSVHPNEINEWTINYYNIVVETTGLHLSGVYKVTPDWLIYGTREYISLLQRYAWHKETDEWNMFYEEHKYDGYLPLPEVPEEKPNLFDNH